VGLNLAVYWMDVSDASYYIFNEKANKGSQTGHTKKYFIKPKIIAITVIPISGFHCIMKNV
jgi:hypothetical protein